MPEPGLSPHYPTDLPAWQALEAHYRDEMRDASLDDLFAADARRFGRFSLESGDLFLDYSKNLLTARTKKLLVQLVGETRIVDHIESMFGGEPINRTEGRPALHVALRAKATDAVGEGVPGVSEVQTVLDQAEAFVSAVQDGVIRGHTGRRLTEIVNIGIGGSDLGAVMASRALRHYWRPGMNFYSVSNVDGTQLVDLTEVLDPEETLFIICSKTFTTQETMTNADAAARWITDTIGADAINAHFAAASTNHEAMDVFGVNPGYRFAFWDWVGGRYSIWSAVGLSLALVIGMDNFRGLLAGARRMDRHFRNAAAHENMPILLALIAVWYNNFFGAEAQAILPYDNRLDRFPAFLQQMQMESNGKRVRLDSLPARTDTGMVIWGEAGSNAQHSFYQLLHQGTRFVPIDFLLPVHSSGASRSQQDLAIANCIAQSEAFMDGYPESKALDDLLAAGKARREAEALAAHKAHPGNRPSNTILFPRLTPEVLGQLIALYEHKVFVEGAIWGINSFDQFGVELGKRLAGPLGEVVTGAGEYAGGNASTRGLLSVVDRLRRKG